MDFLFLASFPPERVKAVAASEVAAIARGREADHYSPEKRVMLAGFPPKAAILFLIHLEKREDLDSSQSLGRCFAGLIEHFFASKLLQ